VKFALPPRGTIRIVGTTFIARKKEFEGFPELTPFEEGWEPLEPAFATSPYIDLVIAPPSTKAAEPRPKRRTIETNATDFFNRFTKV